MSRKFNGINQTLVVVDNPIFNLSTQMSLSAWIKPYVTGINMQIFAKETSLGTRNWGLYYNALNKLGFEITTSVGGTTDTKQGTLTSGVWQHVAVTYDGVNKKSYINGIFVGSDPKTGTIINTSGSLYVGSFIGGYSFFNGEISQPTIWNTSISPPEILSLSLGFSPLHIRPSYIISHWPLSRNYPVEIDIINKRNLSLIANPLYSTNPPLRGK